MNHTLAQPILLLVWVGLLSSSFVVSGKVLPYASPIAATCLRFILTSLCLAPLVWRSSNVKLTVKQIGQYTLISGFLVLFFVGLFESLKTITAEKTAVIYTLLPLISVFLSFIFMGIKTRTSQLLGFLIGTASAIWMLINGQNNLQALSKWQYGDTVFLAACFCLAMHVILIKKWATTQSALTSTFYIALLGSLLLLPIMLFYGDLTHLVWQSHTFWTWLIYLTLFTTLGTFFLQQHLLKKVSPNAFLAMTYLVPAFVIFFQGGLSQFLLSTPALLVAFFALYLITRAP
ncbi:DMT family transporter [Pseudoalteromonas luteoviolacea]|uniref:DMT family transporter n=1 Tax=Pseudoalteromonas luteoviolacea TaxID=43657 RepID=UPI001F1BD69E|nr:DMT family transporter [Pseudoalteromonas luteoviolacea]MCF6440139.1 DMT family transporter [Pseudoalteromonas luteoviolacea]